MPLRAFGQVGDGPRGRRSATSVEMRAQPRRAARVPRGERFKELRFLGDGPADFVGEAGEGGDKLSLVRRIQRQNPLLQIFRQFQPHVGQPT